MKNRNLPACPSIFIAGNLLPDALAAILPTGIPRVNPWGVMAGVEGKLLFC